MLALEAAPRLAAGAQGDALHRGGEPGLRGLALVAQGGEPGLLDDVAGGVGVEQEAARQAAQGGGVDLGGVHDPDMVARTGIATQVRAEISPEPAAGADATPSVAVGACERRGGTT